VEAFGFRLVRINYTSEWKDPKSFHPNKKAHPAFEVRNLENIRRRLASNGIEMKSGEALEGADRFYSEDPFGNRLEFIEWKK
jgi:catechol 2,3-dioxygenase-like lactoylglutathione lyase family enzyme